MSEPNFWRGVKQDVIAGVGVAATVAVSTGIFYLVYTVPTKLDDVLSNQLKFEKQVGNLEERVMDHEGRLIKLEMQK